MNRTALDEGRPHIDARGRNGLPRDGRRDGVSSKTSLGKASMLVSRDGPIRLIPSMKFIRLFESWLERKSSTWYVIRMETRSEKDKMLAGELYQAFDDELFQERQKAKHLCREFNRTSEDEMDQRHGILRQLLGTCGSNPFIEPSFRCDYGYNIHVGDNFYSNYDLIILDCREVRIGHNCMIAPRVSIFTATHPIDAGTRVAGFEFAKPVTIGENVWIGGHAVINPGVTIGDNVVVAAGAVVTTDVPDNVVVAGVPARILRNLI